MRTCNDEHDLLNVNCQLFAIVDSPVVWVSTEHPVISELRLPVIPRKDQLAISLPSLASVNLAPFLHNGKP